MIQEKMKASHTRQKSYHNKRRKSLEFQKGSHVFLKVTSVIGVRRALNSKKLIPRFIGPYQISQRIEVVAYRVALSLPLLNLHGVFHVSQLQKYIPDMSHIIQMDDLQVRKNLTIKAIPIRIEDRDGKQLRGKEIALVKMVWGGPTRGCLTWKLESRMEESYSKLFSPNNFRGRKLF